MLRGRLIRTRLTSLPRVFVAIALSLALLSGTLSLGVAAAVHHCSMPCCTGGEMAGGENSSCEVNLDDQTHAQHGSFQTAKETQIDEPLCGATQTVVANSPPAKPLTLSKHSSKTAGHAAHSEEAKHRQHRFSNALTQKCPQPCTGAATASSQSRRSKELALPASKASQQSSLLLSAFISSVIPFAPNLLDQHLSPRGPPSFPA